MKLIKAAFAALVLAFAAVPAMAEQGLPFGEDALIKCLDQTSELVWMKPSNPGKCNLAVAPHDLPKAAQDRTTDKASLSAAKKKMPMPGYFIDPVQGSGWIDAYCMKDIPCPCKRKDGPDAKAPYVIINGNLHVNMWGKAECE